MYTVNFLINIIQDHQFIAYGLIFIGLIFEGEFILILTGILSHLGALNFYIALVFIFLGGLSKTFLGYYLGTILHKKYKDTKFFLYIKKKVLNFVPNFEKKPFWSIFISKFIMGVNSFVIIFAGYLKVDFKKYLRAEITATIIWVPLLLCLGYFFGYTALSISKEIWKFSLIIVLLMFIFVLIDKFIGWLYEIFEEFYDF